MNYLKAFIAGFIGTVVFHQGLLGLLYLGGISPYSPFQMASAGPLGVPSFVSLAFWGGIWAMALMPLLRRFRGGTWWTAWAIAGAVLPSAVGLFIVLPLKNKAMAGGWDPELIVGALLLNAAWGIGTAIVLRLLKAR